MNLAVTGIGLVTPLGVGREATWKAVKAGRSGADRLNPAVGGVRIAARVPGVDAAGSARAVAFGVTAVREALEDAGIHNGGITRECALVLGASKGGAPHFSEVPPESFWEVVPGQGLVDAVGAVLRWPGLRRGVSAACSTGAHAVMLGAGLLLEGRVDAAVCGAAESSLSPLILAGFRKLGVLASGNGDPGAASRPFDRTRAGFVVGEGAAVVVLERLDRARSRGARVYGEMAGWAMGASAAGVTRPAGPEPLAGLIRRALDRGGMSPGGIQYLHAHGTGTVENDRLETRAIRLAFGSAADRIPVSSTKPLTGHLLGASGSAGLAFTLLAMRDSVIPPTINLRDPDPDCDLDYVPGAARLAVVDAAVSVAMGFGGQMGVLAVRRA